MPSYLRAFVAFFQESWLYPFMLWGALALMLGACGAFVPTPDPSPTPAPIFSVVKTIVVTPATVTPTPPPAVRALYLTLTPTATPSPIQPTATPTPYPGGIVPGQPARVVARTGLNVREAPSPTARRLGNYPPNAVVKVMEGPVNQDGYLWWRVDNGHGLAGWVAGGDDQEVWLSGELGDKRPVNRPVRLGDVVQVTTANGRNLSIRYEPGVRGLLIKRVVAGTHLQVIDGPVILDNVRWWKVQRADGLTGWAAEGSTRERWLSPLE